MDAMIGTDEMGGYMVGFTVADTIACDYVL